MKELPAVRKSLAIHGLNTVVNHNARRRMMRREISKAKKGMDGLEEAGKEGSEGTRIELRLEIKQGEKGVARIKPD